MVRDDVRDDRDKRSPAEGRRAPRSQRTGDNAVGLLQLLDGVPSGDSVETELQKELRLILILGDTP
jgi:hypothetical protein